MNPSTRAAIKADREIPQDRKGIALQFLGGQGSTPLPRLAVTQAEAARMLSVSRITVYRLVQAGDLHPVSIRGARRYRVEDLAQLAGANRPNQTRETP